MAVEYGFFDFQPDGETDAEYSEDQGSVVFGAAVPDGLWPYDSANGAAAVSGDGVSIAVGTQGFAKGFYFKVTGEAENVAVDAADSSARIDRIVARLDKSANTFVPHYLKGTAGSVTPPSLTRGDDTYDLRMWQVTRATNGGLSLKDERDWGALDIHATTSANQPPSNIGYGFEYQADTDKLIRRDAAGSRKTLLEDTGNIRIGPYGDWRTTVGFYNNARRLNGWVRVRLALERITAPLTTADPDGSPLIQKLPAGYRPEIIEYVTATISGGRTGRVLIDTDGSVSLWTISSNIPVGANLRATLVFPGA